jgi:Flp pilus assembly protein protease CpaA
MNTKSKRCVTLISSIVMKTLDVRTHMISNLLVLMSFIFACFNLIIPSEITADETDTAVFGLYRVVKR